jgi:hypothetical protein
MLLRTQFRRGRAVPDDPGHCRRARHLVVNPREKGAGRTGSAVALAAFIATQTGWITSTSAPYLAMNMIGSAGLVTSAIAESQWGFVILESVWAAVSAFGLSGAQVS